MTPPPLGVVLVTYDSADVILDCLETLLASTGVALEIVVVDNASPDATPAHLRDWASGAVPWSAPADMPFATAPIAKPVDLSGRVRTANGHALTLVETGANLGFAAGVNRGLAALAERPEIDRFWILNPDSAVPPGTAAAFARHPVAGDFSLMGGRLVYYDVPGQIQLDGGLVDWRTGVTHNARQFAPPNAPPSDPAGLDFITGASMVASRRFLETIGPMPEDYFLYYEEVDWALRRGELPLAYCPGAIVYHRAGTSIGSPGPGRPASPFSLYFKHRGRLRFLRRHRRRSVVTAQLYTLAKAGQLLLGGHLAEVRALLAGAFDRPPPAEVRARLSAEAQALAFASPGAAPEPRA